jgi:hypothetical protein
MASMNQAAPSTEERLRRAGSQDIRQGFTIDEWTFWAVVTIDMLAEAQQQSQHGDDANLRVLACLNASNDRNTILIMAFPATRQASHGR